MGWTENPNWDLESIFAGGVDGDPFRDALIQVEQELGEVCVRADALGDPATDPAWGTVLPQLLDLETRLHQAWTFAACHSAAQSTASAPLRAEARCSEAWTRLVRAWTRPDHHVSSCSDKIFDALCERTELADVAPILRWRRAHAHLVLPEPKQALLAELTDPGLHAWGRRYKGLAGNMQVHVNQEVLSLSQAQNRLEDPEPGKRREAFEGLQAAWQQQLEPCADSLSHITRFRTIVAQHQGAEPLDEPMADNRIGPAALEAVMETCRICKPLVARYLQAKARLLGKQTLDWWDLRAPIGATEARRSYQEAQQMVVDELDLFSPEMGQFVRTALEQQWVEAEDRPGKRGGAFCATLPVSGEIRVFLTFGGGALSTLTLAHELGHGYHGWVMRDLPRSRRRVPSTLAETASVFAENLLRRSSLARAQQDAQRLRLLDFELTAACTFLTNIPVRFDFERSLYQMRSRGPLDPSELDERMQQLQRSWYGPVLGRAFPEFWAAKLHFYLSSSPFYNFPYTVGYLFSSLVVERARAEGPAWASRYRELLRATGVDTVEEVGARQLGVDLTRPEAYQPVIERLSLAVEQFEALAIQS
ncbi:MAG: M3 family metallopeptidase [Myxococcota bacterium]|nr:M3 family metallopeptidase [Myxococcota bacterium]